MFCYVVRRVIIIIHYSRFMGVLNCLLRGWLSSVHLEHQEILCWSPAPVMPLQFGSRRTSVGMEKALMLLGGKCTEVYYILLYVSIISLSRSKKKTLPLTISHQLHIFWPLVSQKNIIYLQSPIETICSILCLLPWCTEAFCSEGSFFFTIYLRDTWAACILLQPFLLH